MASSYRSARTALFERFVEREQDAMSVLIIGEDPQGFSREAFELLADQLAVFVESRAVRAARTTPMVNQMRVDVEVVVA